MAEPASSAPDSRTSTVADEASGGVQQPPRRPRRRFGMLALAIGLVGVCLWLIATIGVRNEKKAEAPRNEVPQLRPPAGASLPRVGEAAPPDRTDASDVAELDAWSKRLSNETEIPARVLAAYGRAEMWMRTEQPTCQLSWATVAGVARVESHHGGLGGTKVGVDGNVSKPIIGPVLDGSPGVQAVPDTDAGKFDGDITWDRAVGPMQFLPATWNRWAARASADGAEADPQNIDDSALTSARYLCSSGGDLATAEGWWKAVLTYNESVSYGQDVYSGADAYAAASTNS